MEGFELIDVDGMFQGLKAMVAYKSGIDSGKIGVKKPILNPFLQFTCDIETLTERFTRNLFLCRENEKPIKLARLDLVKGVHVSSYEMEQGHLRIFKNDDLKISGMDFWFREGHPGVNSSCWLSSPSGETSDYELATPDNILALPISKNFSLNYKL